MMAKMMIFDSDGDGVFSAQRKVIYMIIMMMNVMMVMLMMMAMMMVMMVIMLIMMKISDAFSFTAFDPRPRQKKNKKTGGAVK